MLEQQNELKLVRCPHCNVVQPRLSSVWQTGTTNHSGDKARWWVIYVCSSCGGLVTTWAYGAQPGEIMKIFPGASEISDSIPGRARSYLTQAKESQHAPSGAVMLTASAVDAMLKAKGYKEGDLFHRIDKAVKDNLITAEMAAWAHEVRLDANDQRHADENAELASETDAQRAFEFALALGEFLFVLPERVKSGRQSGKGSEVLNKSSSR